jgi:septum formation protein
MNFPKILLASKSPRRHEIFEKSGFNFEVVQIEAHEDFPPELKGPEICCYLSEWKSSHYTQDLKDVFLVTADTIVVIDDLVLNKPSNYEEAVLMLQMLSGREHTVYTGVTIKSMEKTHTFYESTQVTFKDLTHDEIHSYIKNCQPFDKAGSYGIQDWMGFIGVKSIQGCFYNVMGFPASKFYRELTLFLA